jgi:hypothetical protein
MKKFMCLVAIVVGFGSPMKLWLVLLISLCFATAGRAQTTYLTTAGYGYNQASTVYKTGYGDVACAGGVCLVPGSHGYHNLQYPGCDGCYQQVAVIPQSTAFFALSNPQVFNYRVREFIQVPHSSAIVTTDRYGNQINFLNAGIQSQTTTRSRGQTLFVR